MKVKNGYIHSTRFWKRLSQKKMRRMFWKQYLLDGTITKSEFEAVQIGG